MMEKSEQREFREYLAIFLNRLPVALITFGVVLGLVVLYTITQPKIYKASAKVRILKETPTLATAPLSFYSLAPDLDTAVKLMTSHDVLDKAIKYIGRNSAGEVNNKTLGEMASAIKVNALSGTDIVQIDATSPNPHRAMLMANALANAFVEEVDNIAKRESRETRIFLEEQIYGNPKKGIKGMEKTLNEIEAKIRDFQKQEGFVDIDKETSSLIDRVGNLRAEIEGCDISIKMAQARLDKVENILKQQGEWVVSGKTLADTPSISKLRDAIADAEIKLLTLQEKYTENNPEVLEAKKNLDNLKRELEERLKQRVREEVGENLTLNPLQSERISAQLEIFTNEAKKKALENYLQPLEAKLSTLPDKSLAYARLQRERQTLSTLYTDLLQRLQEARVRETTTRGNAYIAETATLPTSPAFPPRNLLISTGFILAIFLSVAAALLAEYLDDTVKAPVDAERDLGVAVLGAVPQFEAKEGNLPVLTQPRSSAAEAFRTLRANIKFSQLDKPLKVLLVTSSIKGEGKTVVASNLALTFSTGGVRTLLIDCDMRHPEVHRLFGFERDKGLTNVLVGEEKLEECVREVGENLFVLPCGPVPPNPVEMLDSQKMRDLLSECKEKFDMVVIDSPPIMGMADALVLSAISDGVLMLAKSGSTRRGVFRQAMASLEKAGGRLLGLVLNFLVPRRGYYYYYYYYYYGYGYGKERKSKKKG